MLNFKAITSALLIASILTGTCLADPVGGSQRGHHRVDAHDSDYFTIVLRGGEDTLIFVSGDGDTDLDLYVYDENGNLVESDTDATDDCLVRIHPRWTGKFRIKVRNLGSVWNAYTIAVE